MDFTGCECCAQSRQLQNEPYSRTIDEWAIVVYGLFCLPTSKFTINSKQTRILISSVPWTFVNFCTSHRMLNMGWNVKTSFASCPSHGSVPEIEHF